MKSLFTLIFIFLVIGEKPSKEIYGNGEFIFSLKIFENGQEMTLKFNSPQYNMGDREILDNAWELTKRNQVDKTTIAYLGLKIMGGKVNGNQKAYKWNYYNSDFKNIGGNGVTGLIENDSLIWLHPPREKYFKILEINPFPEMRFNEKKWSTKLKVGEQWGNKRWKTWKGNITISSDYTYNKDSGKVTAIANSELGSTQLITEFDKTNGIKKLDYTNIDGSRIILEFVEKRN